MLGNMGVYAAQEIACQNSFVCLAMERGVTSFVSFSKELLNPKMVKKFSLKSFLEQWYLMFPM